MDAKLANFSVDLRRRFPGWGALHAIESIGGGLSGASLFRIASDGGSFAVKATPASNLSLDLLRARHEVLLALERTASAPIFPRLELDRDGAAAWFGAIGREDFVCETREWLPADEEVASGDPAVVLRSLSSAVDLTARFHARAASLALSPASFTQLASPASFPQRYVDELSRIDGGRIDLVRSALPRAASETRHLAESYLSRLPAVVAELRNAFASLRETPPPVRLCLRDVHRKNVAYRDGAAVAFLDWDALRFDRRIVDFARLAVSFGVSQVVASDLASEACERQGRAERLTSWERSALAPAMMAQVWIPPLNWLDWLLVEKRAFSDASGANARMSETLRAIQGFAKFDS